MKNNWIRCKNILCIRPDNMGDLLMSAPAMRALKESFGCKITLLTSSMAAAIVPFLPEVDECILFNAPWVKTNESGNSEAFYHTINEIKKKSFDAAVIFTVFSQNPMPSATIAYLADIPKRLAYCRENPYALLTHWVPDEEPYNFVQHQVERDLHLVKTVGAVTEDKKLHVSPTKNTWQHLSQKLALAGVDCEKPWLVFHAGVSEEKREYPQSLWIETGKLVAEELNYQIILTGVENEKHKLEEIKEGIGRNAFNTAGLFNLEEFITLIKWAQVVVSVNTSTIHIAAATGTPVIVLYALSNPQHSPWMARGKVLLFDVPDELRSRNQVVQYVHQHLHPQDIQMVMPEEILHAIKDVLFGDGDTFIPAMIPLQKTMEQVF